MRLIATLVILTSLSSATPFLRQSDKQDHMKVTTIIALMSSFIASEKGCTTGESLLVGIGSALFVGFIKELSDSRSGGSGFSGKDMIADGIGGVIGSVPVFVYKW